MSTTCGLCPKPKDHDHHVTGKFSDGTYLDPQFVVPLCQRHHNFAHASLRLARIDRPLDDRSESAVIERLLRRTADFLSVIVSEHPEKPMPTCRARQFVDFANQLCAFRSNNQQRILTS